MSDFLVPGRWATKLETVTFSLGVNWLSTTRLVGEWTSENTVQKKNLLEDWYAGKIPQKLEMLYKVLMDLKTHLLVSTKVEFTPIS